jgi:regulator of ribonuclease activity A
MHQHDTGAHDRPVDRGSPANRPQPRAEEPSDLPPVAPRGGDATGWSTPQLSDAHPELAVLTSPLLDYGGHTRFAGPVVVVRNHDRNGPDSAIVTSLAATPGEGRVLVVDAAGIRSRAVLDHATAATAAAHGWSGLIVHGVVRDVELLRTVDIGVKALGASPRAASRLGAGERDVPAEFGSVVLTTGDHVYADESGVVISKTPLALTEAS